VRQVQIILALVVPLLGSMTLKGDDAKREPREIDRSLTKFAAILGEDGEGGYKWPQLFQKIEFSTTSGQAGMRSTATITCNGSDVPGLRLCLLIAAQSFGVALHQGLAVDEAVIVFQTPDGTGKSSLQLKACKAMGEALLGKPRDDDKIKDAIFDFTIAHMNALPKLRK
jgi:hypothetical protein